MPHLFAITDLATTAEYRNGRRTNPNIIGVRFSVAQHESINIWGSSATLPGTATVESPGRFTSEAPIAPVVDASGRSIVLVDPDAKVGLALLSSTDTNPLQEMNQQAAPLDFDNLVVTPTGRPEGLAELEFVAGPAPGIAPMQETPRPVNDTPLVEAPLIQLTAPSVTSDIYFGSGAASDAAIGTDVYLQIRRQYELDSEADIVIPRITDNTFISNRESFEKFVRENPLLQDGAGYEVWLITETSGQQVERPIVKFEVTGGRPGPATEELPDTFEPYELKPLEFQQPDENGEPLPEPMGETSAIVKPLEVSSVVAVGKISDREYAEASVDVDGTAESAQNQIAADSSQAGAEQPDNGVRQDVS